MTQEIAAVYKSERSEVLTSFSTIFKQCVTMAEKVKNKVSTPRITSRQQHRNNIAANSPEDYYRRSVAIPFLDHIITHLEHQFSCAAVTAISLLGLIPSILCAKEPSLDEIVSKYKAILPSPELLHMELKHWKNKFMGISPSERPCSPAMAYKAM